jgi:O-antigen ligase
LFVGKNSLEVLIFFFGVTLIPTLSLTNFNLKLIFIKYGKSFYFIFNILSFLILFNNYYGENGRLSGNSVLNPITVSEIASCSILLNILFFYNFKKKLLITYFANISFLIVNLLVLLLSASRGPLLGLITTVLFYLYYNKKIKIKTVLIFLFIFLMLYLFIIIFSDKLGLVFLNRMVVNTGNGEKPQEERILLWLEGFEIIKNNILIGSTTTTSLGYVHNFLIELLMSTGLIGLIIFIVPFKAALNNMILHLKNSNIYLQWIGLLFMLFFVNGLFSSMIWTNNYFFHFFALMLSKPLITNIQIKH